MRQLDSVWQIGVVRAPISRFLEHDFFPAIEWLPQPAHRYHADPFAFTLDAQPLIACEAYDYRRRRGELIALDIRVPGAPRSMQLLQSAAHLSFPCMVQDGAALYCVPEQGRSGCTQLYRFDRELRCLVPQRPLLEGFAASDPILFQRDGLWWLFATDHGALPAHALHAFYASELLGPFTAHPLNPVRVDAAWTRAAGLPFTHAGRWYRPVQDCSVRYGAGIQLVEMLELTPDSFVERIERRIAPWDARFTHGLHTLSAFGELTLLDGARASRVPPVARAALGLLRAWQMQRGA